MSRRQGASTANTYSLKNFTILLVEDYDFVQNLITGMLKAFGVGNIMVCSGGDEAKGLLSMMAASKGDMRRPDIILTDWMMPEGSGEGLVSWIRQHNSDKIKFMPIILLSAFASEDVVRGARDFGANEALVKPVSGEMMAKRILSVIDHPRPYVKAPDFFGPDRRRKVAEWKNEERRVLTADMIKVSHERL
jgi:two-component system chemotaxis response regulator CheY